jgi:hypothetical protein
VTDTATTIAAADALLTSAGAAGWRGPDPYDALWQGSWPRWIASRPRGRQVLLQLHARSPVDLRRVYRREHPRIAKALALFGQTAVRLHHVTGEARYRAIAEDALGTLYDDRSAGDAAWGYPFDTQTRWSFYRAGSPNVVVTAFSVFALLEGAAALDRPDWRARAEAAARWIAETLWLPEERAFAYHEGSSTVIHNASLLGARAVHAALGDAHGDRLVAAAWRTLERQDSDGSWPYGDEPGLEFVDGFHTGYVLDSLVDLLDLVPDAESAIAHGAAYYRAHCFGPRGEAWLWPDTPKPEDAHAAGTALSTLTLLGKHGWGDPALLDRVTERVMTSTVRDGHAVCRRWGPVRTTVRYIRWCDAHIAAGLSAVAQAQHRP